MKKKLEMKIALVILFSAFLVSVLAILEQSSVLNITRENEIQKAVISLGSNSEILAVVSQKINTLSTAIYLVYSNSSGFMWGGEASITQNCELQQAYKYSANDFLFGCINNNAMEVFKYTFNDQSKNLTF